MTSNIYKQKRAIAVHDISCIGKCSLTVALPILSTAGVECAALPTALLSNQTGGFSVFSFMDLTSEMTTIIDNWKTIGIGADAIYSGYLGSFEQLKIVSKLIDDFKSDDTLVLVDPVLADAGKLYEGFEEKYISGMYDLCKKADIIVPNITEALFLLGRPYKAGPYDEAFIKEILTSLAEKCCKKIVLTGCYFDEETIGAMAFDGESNTFHFAKSDKTAGFYHGTGDVFASFLLGAIMNGHDLGSAADIAVEFTSQAIKRTFLAQTDTRLGVQFEQSLPLYAEALKK